MLNTLQNLEEIKSKTKNNFVQYVKIINNTENQENLLNSYGKNRENNTKKLCIIFEKYYQLRKNKISSYLVCKI